jgi:enoyl-CoA hydratase/carnithine racemase
MTEQQVHLEIDGPVARIVLANPDKLNALTYVMFDQLIAACGEVTSAARSGQVRVAVLRGDGGRAFAAGTDIAEFSDFRADGPGGGADGVEYEHHTAAMLGAVAALPVPAIAAVEGPAVGNGLALALCCDIVIAREDATFGAPVARTLGNCLSPAVIGRLYAAIGRSRALALLMTASLIDAPAAAAAGLVSEVVPREAFGRHVEDTAARIAGLAPRTLAAFKEADRRVLRALDSIPADDIFASCYGSDDFREGVAAFLAKRPAKWTGR